MLEGCLQGGGGGGDPRFRHHVALPAGTTFAGEGIATGAFDAGQFELTYLAGQEAVVKDGWQETPGWSIPILGLQPSYDPSRHVLEALLTMVAMPAVATKRGMGLALLHQEELAGAQGAGVAWYDNTTTALNGRMLRHQGATSATTTDGVPTDSEALVVAFSFCRSPGAAAAYPRALSGVYHTGEWHDAHEAVGGNMGALSPASWRLRVQGIQASSATEGPVVVSARLSTRLGLLGRLPAP